MLFIMWNYCSVCVYIQYELYFKQNPPIQVLQSGHYSEHGYSAPSVTAVMVFECDICHYSYPGVIRR
ncbi:hypothetical protein EXN66_Car000433 [Channa argus]|uniref:Uncharacterized protein n=1 Tax=Channa argus TaxID=215402 RepID=A0A6G1QX41_CHAAH|nr:hypothetical protein EXN66_Car000433 [Channa argus]